MAEIYQFDDYRELFQHLVDVLPQGGRGAQTRLAQTIGCQQAFLSRVLKSQADLSQEQAFAIAGFFQLSQLEREYWLTLVAENRAGNFELKNYHQAKRIKIRQEHRSLNKRIDAGVVVDEADKAHYYSEWYYTALHVMAAVPEYRNEETMAKRLGLPLEVVKTALEMLVRSRLLVKKGNSYHLSSGSIHLPPTHPLVRKHHSNWRLHSIQRLVGHKEKDLHYTSVMSCSKKDQEKVRQILVEAVTAIRQVVKDSADESVCHYAIDFFEL